MTQTNKAKVKNLLSSFNISNLDCGVMLKEIYYEIMLNTPIDYKRRFYEKTLAELQKQHEEEMLESAKINIGLIKKCQDLKKKVEQFERKVK